ncbi:unnamed protein product [Cochlearia groenlandica]
MEDIEKTTTISDETTPDDFEFGSLTPSSPSKQDSFTENSPADHFFFNGRLLPHSFPTTASNMNSKRSSISRTTSEYTSRSNSTNSLSNISSTSCSPRTSNVNNYNNNAINHKPLGLKQQVSTRGKTVNTTMKGKSTEVVTSTLYRSYSSQRWQYITPIPVKRSGGVRVGNTKKKAARMKKKKKKKKAEERSGSGVMKWWRRILMAAIFFCKECHALEGA